MSNKIVSQADTTALIHSGDTGHHVGFCRGGRAGCIAQWGAMSAGKRAEVNPFAALEFGL